MPWQNGVDPTWDADRATTGRHFLRDMEHLWEQILKLAAVVEAALSHAIQVLCDGRSELAAEVRGEEREIDHWEVQIELECLKVLALHNPVASDLRRVAAILRINGDLERLGDLAEHIANRARKLANEPNPLPIPPRLESLAQEAIAQVRDALDALAANDVHRARAVIAANHSVDRHRRLLQKQLKDAICHEPDRINSWLRLINIGRNLERVSDHAAHIAEAVIYLREGQIVRHRHNQLNPTPSPLREST
ncbi:MAG: phosphate transport system regulatory protein PhoU [Isosphaeraceae bacterium]|jgi:phosphate transport system protein|nr:MAG: phosphate transport system regulatory protein PhoU [Isosphaeraceae bacterium]